MFKEGYYYLHVNGTIIFKPEAVISNDVDYFDSQFIVKWWKVRTESEYNAMLINAKNLIERI